MEKLFRVLPVLVWVALVVAWTFPALALGVRFELWGIQLALPLLWRCWRPFISICRRLVTVPFW